MVHTIGAIRLKKNDVLLSNLNFLNLALRINYSVTFLISHETTNELIIMFSISIREI